MLRLAASFVLGYHGCDRRVADQLIAGARFQPSSNDYDWLGGGAYFWEGNPLRGLEYASRASRRPRSAVTTPAVVGAIIDLGVCLDLTTSYGVEAVRIAHASLEQQFQTAGATLPTNQDRFRRQLDCAVIEHAHVIFDQLGSRVDSVRGVFTEGQPIYPGAFFDAETHVQIAVRNLGCIKGVFRVPDDHLLSPAS